MAYHYELNVTLTRGDDRAITLIFQDNDGDPIDITSWSFWYTAKRAAADSDDDAVIKIEPGSVVKADSGTGTTDSATFKLTSTATAITPRTYLHDIQIKNENNEIKTIAIGVLTVEPGITVRTS